MKIISVNVNGIRSASKKGLTDFISRENPDILCIQEIKATEKDFPENIQNLKNYHFLVNPALKKGYSGVAVFSKIKPDSVNSVFGLERFDKEGRLLELKFPGFTLMNLYLPHGGRQKENPAASSCAMRFGVRRPGSLKFQVFRFHLTGFFACLASWGLNPCPSVCIR